MNDAELRRWREQLSREEAEDSDDEHLGGFGVNDVKVSADSDLGLALEEPMRIPGAPQGGASEDPLDMYAGMPRRAGQAPPGPRPPLPPKMGGGGAGEDPQILMHRLQVLQLKLEERDIELESARLNGGGGAGAGGGVSVDGGAGAGDAREAKMKELARRAKAATMALGRERAKTAELTKELAGLKQQQQQAASTPAAGSGAAAALAGGGGGAAARLDAASARVNEAREGIENNVKDRELKEMKQLLAAANARLHEAKVQGQALKAELSKYQQVCASADGPLLCAPSSPSLLARLRAGRRSAKRWAMICRWRGCSMRHRVQRGARNRSRYSTTR